MPRKVEKTAAETKPETRYQVVVCWADGHCTSEWFMDPALASRHAERMAGLDTTQFAQVYLVLLSPEEMWVKDEA